MKSFAVTLRVEAVPVYAERRDYLDQAWSRFLSACGPLLLLLPNVAEPALALCEPVDGLPPTGGNDPATLGGDALESALLDLATCHLPAVGVCRGMQVIQQRFGAPPQWVEGRVGRHQRICIPGKPAAVNSYHHFAAKESRPPLDVWAQSEDGVVKAMRHSSLPLRWITWYRKRYSPFRSGEVKLVRRFFGAW